MTKFSASLISAPPAAAKLPEENRSEKEACHDPISRSGTQKSSDMISVAELGRVPA